ncbi:hypothetical protein D3C85_1239980 [compost metagenome]
MPVYGSMKPTLILAPGAGWADCASALPPVASSVAEIEATSVVCSDENSGLRKAVRCMGSPPRGRIILRLKYVPL